MINFKISWPLIEGILQTEFKERLLKKRKKKIENYLKKNSGFIFNEIERQTSLKWKNKEINIWLINGNYPTSPKPNLLNISNNIEYIIFELIYLLIHNIFIQNNYYENFLCEYGIDETMLEATVYYYDKKICTRLFSKRIINKIVKESIGEGFKQYVWDEVNQIEKEKFDKNK
ncbi:MAG: hypothetical protein U9Q69_02075 [Nanoarchaeota archaeon]|nr:hypothetical protein [Nanoarchaeota archaeon]